MQAGAGCSSKCTERNLYLFLRLSKASSYDPESRHTQVFPSLKFLKHIFLSMTPLMPLASIRVDGYVTGMSCPGGAPFPGGDKYSFNALPQRKAGLAPLLPLRVTSPRQMNQSEALQCLSRLEFHLASILGCHTHNAKPAFDFSH